MATTYFTNKDVYFYGLDETYRLVHFYFCPRGDLSIWSIRVVSRALRADFPSIRYVYAVDNSPMIYDAYKELRREDSTQSRVEFKLMLEQYGIEI